jgi:hypothetical protein
MSDSHQPFSRPPAGTELDYVELARAFNRLYPSRVNVPVNVHNGSTKFINTMLTVMSLLIVAAICGEVVVYGQVQVLQATVNMIIQGHVK